jgi:hypothetical protein
MKRLGDAASLHRRNISELNAFGVIFVTLSQRGTIPEVMT